MNFKLRNEFNSRMVIDIQDTNKDTIKQLSDSKSLLDCYVKEWDIVKKKIHNYEYVYTSPYMNKNISGILPISRSYFKMKEIIQEFELISEDQLKIFCMAEAPGGFIQGFIEYEKNIKSIGAITLLSKDKSIPYWNKNIKNNKLIQFYDGYNGNGDLYDFKNILSVIKDVGRSSINILTGDGGFDYSKDYNKQEYNSLPLIYSEIFMALNLQKEGGAFICKIFDIFLKETVKLIYLLFLSYDEVHIYKPCLSRLSNSEKYIICTGFKGYNLELVNKLCRSFHNKDLDIYINYGFYQCLKEFNCKYITQQIKQIKMGMDMIYKKELSIKPDEKQIQIAINWCRKYNSPINKNCFFLKRTITRQSPQWRR